METQTFSFPTSLKLIVRQAVHIVKITGIVPDPRFVTFEIINNEQELSDDKTLKITGEQAIVNLVMTRIRNQIDASINNP